MVTTKKSTQKKTWKAPQISDLDTRNTENAANAGAVSEAMHNALTGSGS